MGLKFVLEFSHGILSKRITEPIELQYDQYKDIHALHMKTKRTKIDLTTRELRFESIFILHDN